MSLPSSFFPVVKSNPTRHRPPRLFHLECIIHSYIGMKKSGLSGNEIRDLCSSLVVIKVENRRVERVLLRLSINWVRWTDLIDAIFECG